LTEKHHQRFDLSPLFFQNHVFSNHAGFLTFFGKEVMFSHNKTKTVLQFGSKITAYLAGFAKC
jgi:hypothetical protein